MLFPYPPTHTCTHLLLVDIERRARGSDFQDRRPKQDHRIRQLAGHVAVGHERIHLPHRRHRHHRHDRTPLGRRGHARGGKPAHKRDVETSRQGSGDGEGEGDPLRGRHALRGGQRGEGLDGKSGIAGGARLDEGGGEGVDGVEAEGGAVGVRRENFAEVEALQRGMQGFGHEDGAGDAEVGLAGDEGCAAEVGGGANPRPSR